jgi:hypothetical protein
VGEIPQPAGENAGFRDDAAVEFDWKSFAVTSDQNSSILALLPNTGVILKAALFAAKSPP